MQNSKKNSDGWQKKRRMSKEKRVYFILQSTDQKDLIWGMWQHVRIEERSKLHRKKSVSLNIVMKKLPCTEKYSVLFLYLWGIKYGSSHLSTPFFPDISSLSCNLSTRIFFFFPNIRFFPMTKLRSLQLNNRHRYSEGRYFVFFSAVLFKVSIYTVKTHNKRAKKVDGKKSRLFRWW